MHLVSIGTGPPVTDIFVIPYRASLAAHEGDHLAEIETGATTKGDDTIMPTGEIGLEASRQVFFIRIGIDFGKHRATEAGLIEQVECVLRDRQVGEAAVGDQ